MIEEYVRYALNHFKVIKYLNDNYPKSEYRIAYFWNPFEYQYSGFALIESQIISYNPLNQNYISDDNLYKKLKQICLDLKFEKEFFSNRAYDKEFLLQFLMKLGYKHPAEKILRELVNPFDSTKNIKILYGKNGEISYQMPNGEIKHRERK